MKKHSSTDAKILDTIMLTEEEQEALRHMLRHLGSKDVQQVALDLYRSSKDASGKFPLERGRVAERMRAHLPAFRRLGADVFSELPGRFGRVRKSPQTMQTVQSSRHLRSFGPSRQQ